MTARTTVDDPGRRPLKRGDEVQVSFTARVQRRRTPDGSLRVLISYMGRESFHAIVPDYVCRLLEGEEDEE